jgi:NADH-quinone oxidoreductase subunit N
MILPPDVGDWAVIAPALVLALFAGVTLLFGVFSGERAPLGGLSLTGIGAALLVAGYLWLEPAAEGTRRAFGGAVLADLPALAFTVVILIGAALATLLADAHVERMGLDQPEFHPLLLLSTAGALVLVSAGDLITMLLGLEIMSLAVYVLAAWRDRSRPSEEAGMKYFLLGAFASAFAIYGIALTYGATGRFGFAAIAEVAAAPGFDQGALLLLGAVFLLVGLGFKVAFAPFHQWAPDVYTGAPTPVTAFMSVVVKAAAFGVLLRVVDAFTGALGAGANAAVLPLLLSLLIGATLIVGNFGALLQSGLKRLLAYSAVAHAGYVGLAVLAGGDAGLRAAAFYLLAYTFTGLLAFAALLALLGDDDRGDRLERLAGLGRRRPLLAVALAVALGSLAGFPPFAGFVAKVVVFQAAIAAGHVALAVLGIVTSVVAVFYYARVALSMFLVDSAVARVPARERPPLGRRAAAALALALAGVLLLGLFPGGWLAAFAA